MSRLLINENPLQVLPTLACAIGLNEAVVLQQIHYWMSSSQHFYDGRRWVYNSVASWQKQFPFWSEATIKRALVSLERQEMVSCGNYNRDPRDRSKWYSINYAALEALEQHNKPVNDAFGQFDQMEQRNMTKCNDAGCSDAPGHDDPMQLGNMTKPLPENTTEITQEITAEIKNTIGADAGAPTPTVPPKLEYSPAFEEVWSVYPKRHGGNSKQAAWKAWSARLKQGVAPEVMLAGVKRYAVFLAADGKIGTAFVKQASTFFGPDRHFDEDWAVAGNIPEQPQQSAGGLQSWYARPNDGSAEVFINQAAIDRLKRGANRP